MYVYSFKRHVCVLDKTLLDLWQVDVIVFASFLHPQNWQPCYQME